MRIVSFSPNALPTAKRLAAEGSSHRTLCSLLTDVYLFSISAGVRGE
jgi:hypothetical protein